MDSLRKFNFISPSTCIIAGPTGSGKTNLMLDLLKHHAEIFSKPVDKIIWCYSIFQERFRDFPYIEFHEGVYDIDTLSPKTHTVVVIDDLMHKLNEKIAETFTVFSHHLNVSVFFLCQNIFFQNKHMRDVNLNAQYLILFAQRRDVRQVSILASQMFPTRTSTFMKIYKETTARPYGYLVCDLHPSNNFRILLRTNILPSEAELVYIPE